jgi:hypothetical protein
MSFGTTTHAKIASGQTVSGEVDLRGLMLLGISTPAALTGVTLSFQAADVPTAVGGVYVSVLHLNVLAATAFTITGVAASQHIVIDGSLLPNGIGNCMLKVVSGSAEAADRDLILFTRPI